MVLNPGVEVHWSFPDVQVRLGYSRLRNRQWKHAPVQELLRSSMHLEHDLQGWWLKVNRKINCKFYKGKTNNNMENKITPTSLFHLCFNTAFLWNFLRDKSPNISHNGSSIGRKTDFFFREKSSKDYLECFINKVKSLGFEVGEVEFEEERVSLSHDH